MSVCECGENSYMCCQYVYGMLGNNEDKTVLWSRIGACVKICKNPTNRSSFPKKNFVFSFEKYVFVSISKWG